MTIALGAPSARSIRRELAIDGMVIMLIALLCMFFFWRLIDPLVSERMHVVKGDFVNQFYPYQHFVASELQEGRIPLWNPYIFAGHPVFADVQMAISYPVGLLLNFLLGLDGLTLLDVELRLILDYFLAGTFTYLFVKHTTGHRFAGLLSAIVFSFGGYLLSYPGQQAPILESALWLPMVLLFLRRSVTGHTWLPNLCLAGAVQALAILAGHPQTAMFLFYTSCLYAFWLVNRKGLALRKTVVTGTVFASVSLTLSAIQLLPAIEFLPMSTRMSMAYEEASRGFEFSSALGVILPDWRNERSLYVGIMPLFLALWAVCRNVSGTKFWACAAILSMLLSFGGRTPLFTILFSVVPGFSLFRDQERMVLVFAFAVSVLAGHGVSRAVATLDGTSVQDNLRSLLIPIGLLAAASAVPFFTADWTASASFKPDLYGGMLSGYQLLLLFSAATIGFMVILLSRKRSNLAVSAAIVPSLIIAFAVFDLFVVNWQNNITPTAPTISQDVLAVLEHIKAQPGTFRIRIENDDILPSNYPAMFELAHVGGDTPFRVHRVQQLLEKSGEWRLWQLFNVDYVVTRRVFADGVDLAFSEGSINAYKVSYGLPRAYAVTQYVVASPDEALDLTTSMSNHPGDVVFMEEQPSFVQPHPGATRPDVDVVEHSPQRIRIRAHGDVDAMLIVADTFYPGWRATVDGAAATIYRANYAFRAVQIPAGEHVVEMVFDPSSYRIGAIISLAGWVLFLVLGVRALCAYWRPLK